MHAHQVEVNIPNPFSWSPEGLFPSCQGLQSSASLTFSLGFLPYNRCQLKRRKRERVYCFPPLEAGLSSVNLTLKLYAHANNMLLKSM